MQRRMLVIAMLASAVVAVPVAAARGAASNAKTLRGIVFGGVTEVTNAAGAKESAYPVVIRLNRTGTRVMRATIGLDLKCGSPGDITIPDDVAQAGGIPIKNGLFIATQPVTHVDADPAAGLPPLDISARVSGRVNKAHTRIKGTWTRTIVIYNPEAPTSVLDTCTSTLRYVADN